jgi:flagellar hook-length control protein FliK
MRPVVANVVMLQNYSAAILPTTVALTGPNTGLLGQALDAPRAAIPASTTLSANTLVELPSASRHMLPVRLSQTVSESGMFYESHLAKWSKGTLSLEAIQREPQARIGQDGQMTAKLAELGGMPEEAGRLAGRQLQMLEGAPFLWQGLAWPGQAMEWQVREETVGEGQGESDETASEWVTELKLTLPRMGSVHAQLGLSGDRLRLRLLATEEATRDALAAALPLLAKGLEASGLHAVEMLVDGQVGALHAET